MYITPQQTISLIPKISLSLYTNTQKQDNQYWNKTKQ